MSEQLRCRFVVRETLREACLDPQPCADGHLVHRYRTPAGELLTAPEPGDVFFHHAHAAGAPCNWNNCDGRHLFVILPGGRWWNLDGRDSNCTLPNDTTHRCWVRHGDPSKGELHVDKVGHTCQAGAGSIDVGDWHGFLHSFALRKC